MNSEVPKAITPRANEAPDTTQRIRRAPQPKKGAYHFAIELSGMLLMGLVVYLDHGAHVELSYLAIGAACGLLGIRVKNGPDNGPMGIITAIGTTVGVIHNA